MSSQVYSHGCRIASSKDFFAGWSSSARSFGSRKYPLSFQTHYKYLPFTFTCYLGIKQIIETFPLKAWSVKPSPSPSSQPIVYLSSEQVWDNKPAAVTSTLHFFFHKIYTTKLSSLITLLKRLFNDNLEDREYQEPMLAEYDGYREPEWKVFLHQTEVSKEKCIQGFR